MDNNDLSGIIEKLMSDPAAIEMVQKLKQGTLSPENATATEATSPTDGSKNSSSPDTAKLLSTIAPLLNGIKGNSENASSELKRRNQLLSALKPYLSRERQEMIDTLTSLSGMSGILDMFSGGGQRNNEK